MGTPRYSAGDIVAGKYRLESVLGEGGMGTVWRALNVELEAPVALKLIRAELDRELFTQRLKQEARAAAKLGHPGIVRVFDVGCSEYGDPFIVMELLNGRSLSALLLAERRLTAVRAVQLLLPVADALSAAHAKGIVHRDLKPDNIFLAVDGEQLQPKLVDFGIVKLAGQSEVPQHLTEAGMVLGSPAYMSPEQARGRDDLDHRTDIWSFCVVLYETLAGAIPFAAANYNALLSSIVEDEPPSLLGYLASDEALWQIIRRGLAKDREERFGSMSDLGRALAAWLRRQGIREDACGASLDSKWINRRSDPFAPRATRGAFASLTGLQPESGVRAASPENLGNAPTLGWLAPRNEQSGTLLQSGRHGLTLTRASLLLGAFIILLIMAIVVATRSTQPRRNSALRQRAAEPAASAMSVPSPSPITTHIVPTPEHTAPHAVEPIPITSVHSKVDAVRSTSKHGVSGPSASRPAQQLAKTPASAAPGDLLIPY